MLAIENMGLVIREEKSQEKVWESCRQVDVNIVKCQAETKIEFKRDKC